MDFQYASQVFGKCLREHCSPHRKCKDGGSLLMKVELCCSTVNTYWYALKIYTLAIPRLHVHIALLSVTTTVCLSLFNVETYTKILFCCVLKIEDHPILVSLFRARRMYNKPAQLWWKRALFQHRGWAQLCLQAGLHGKRDHLQR